MTNTEQARHLLAFWLRQGVGGTPPAQVPLTPELLKLVDATTAQKLWTELLAARAQKSSLTP